jgi:hypothetical protein
MTNVDKLKEEELAELDGEINLEDLIILGDDSKIPITITFPKGEGGSVKAKALIKQLTLKELNNVNTSNNNLLDTSKLILRKALFKHDGKPFSDAEIEFLPIGVIVAISNKIMEVSGMDNFMQETKDF